jgi:hypothetical protein
MLAGAISGDTTTVLLSDADLEGVWTGRYHYRKIFGLELSSPVQFHVVFERGDDGLRGRIYEPNTFGRRSAEHLAADVVDLEREEGVIRFRKQYDGTGGVKHGVVYEGNLSEGGRSVEGTWKIGRLGSGTFEMAKEDSQSVEQFQAGAVPAFEKPEPRRWPAYLIGGILATVFLLSMWNIRLSPEARDARAFLSTMPVERITEIRLEPNASRGLLNTTIHITDRKQIAEIAAAFRAATGISPNHPHSKWSVTVRFITPEREYGGHISQTTNQGTLFWYSSSVTSGWNYGTYRNDALAPLIQNIMANPIPPANTPPAEAPASQ